MTTDKTLYNLMLPSMIYAVQGQELNVYFDGILSANHVVPSECSWNVDWTPVGTDGSKHENGRFTLVPAVGNVGDSTLTITALLGSQRAKRRTTLRVRGTSASPPVTRKLLAIGDSTTAGGTYLAELVNLCTGSGLTITTVGTQTSTLNDSDGDSRTVYHEGVRGGISFYYTENVVVPVSPFVIGGTFNFAAYLANNNITLSANDWVIVVLGINDIFSYTDDASCKTHIATITTQLNAMITNIKAAVSGIRIGIATIIAPSQNQDSFGHDYNSGQTRDRYKRNRDLWVQQELDKWDNQQANGIYLIPMHACLDTANNMQTLTVAANARNAATVVRQSNGVHPATAGYWQMADALYAFLRGQET